MLKQSSAFSLLVDGDNGDDIVASALAAIPAAKPSPEKPKPKPRPKPTPNPTPEAPVALPSKPSPPSPPRFVPGGRGVLGNGYNSYLYTRIQNFYGRGGVGSISVGRGRGRSYGYYNAGGVGAMQNMSIHNNSRVGGENNRAPSAAVDGQEKSVVIVDKKDKVVTDNVDKGAFVVDKKGKVVTDNVVEKDIFVVVNKEKVASNDDEKEKVVSDDDEKKKDVSEKEEKVVTGNVAAATETRETSEKIDAPKDVELGEAESKKAVQKKAPKNKQIKKKEEDEKDENEEMTLPEYEKMLAEKRKSLEVLKREERKVTEDQFNGMLPVPKEKEEAYSNKNAEKSKQKEEKVHKPLRINHFLMLDEDKDEDLNRPLPTFGRGAIRRGGYRGGYSGSVRTAPVPNFDDVDHFPALKAVEKPKAVNKA